MNKDICYYQKRMREMRNGTISKAEMATELIQDLEGWIRNTAFQKYGTHPQEYEDLVQIGRAEIFMNLDRYDPDTKPQLPITFFDKYINGAMYQYVCENCRGLKKDSVFRNEKINKAIAELKRLKVEVTIPNIVRAIGDPAITEEVVYNNLQKMRGASGQIHYDKVNSEGFSLVNSFAGNIYDPEKEYAERERREIIAEVLKDELTKLERKVCELLIMDEHTIHEVSEMLSISANDVKRLRTSVTLKLSNSEKLHEYLGAPKKKIQREYIISLEEEDPDNNDMFGDDDTIIIIC